MALGGPIEPLESLRKSIQLHWTLGRHLFLDMGDPMVWGVGHFSNGVLRCLDPRTDSVGGPYARRRDLRGHLHLNPGSNLFKHSTDYRYHVWAPTIVRHHVQVGRADGLVLAVLLLGVGGGDLRARSRGSVAGKAQQSGGVQGCDHHRQQASTH